MKKLEYINVFILIILCGILGYLISYPFDLKFQTIVISVLFLSYLTFFLYKNKK